MTQKMLDEFQEVFKNEINQIKNKEYKKIFLDILKECPNYVLTIPSSSTGKYHPTDEIKSDGMIRHIKRLVMIVPDFIRYHQIPEDKIDLANDVLVAAAILHDIYKNGPTGKSKYTVKEHPVYIAETIYKYNKDLLYPLANEYCYYLIAACLFHEGQWTIDKSRDFWNKHMPPMNDYARKLSQVMHTIDYVASRRSVYESMVNLKV